jgi:hypothetical protein
VFLIAQLVTLEMKVSVNHAILLAHNVQDRRILNAHHVPQTFCYTVHNVQTHALMVHSKTTIHKPVTAVILVVNLALMLAHVQLVL